jgi:Ca2+-binding EF-hand superfamily protein
MVHTTTSERFSSVFASFDKDADGKISASRATLG